MITYTNWTNWCTGEETVEASPLTIHCNVNTLRPRQNGRHFANDFFKCILLNENVWIPSNISLKFVPEGHINNIPVLVQIVASRRQVDEPLSEPMMVRLPTHLCVTRPQWVTAIYWSHRQFNFFRLCFCRRLPVLQVLSHFANWLPMRYHAIWHNFELIQHSI